MLTKEQLQEQQSGRSNTCSPAVPSPTPATPTITTGAAIVLQEPHPMSSSPCAMLIPRPASHPPPTHIMLHHHHQPPHQPHPLPRPSLPQQPPVTSCGPYHPSSLPPPLLFHHKGHHPHYTPGFVPGRILFNFLCTTIVFQHVLSMYSLLNVYDEHYTWYTTATTEVIWSSIKVTGHIALCVNFSTYFAWCHHLLM